MNAKLNFDSTRALELLRLGCGLPRAEFREGQEEAIRHVVERAERLLVVQKTGWGKSFVYFIAAKLLREAERGPTLLVSPLIALMRNQLAAAERMGVRAETIHSDNKDDWDAIEGRIGTDQVDVLLISPERLANARFVEKVLEPLGERVELVVIDEAHCISDWGHDFRPHYRLIQRVLRELPENIRVLATTATANDRVMADLESVLGPGLAVSRGDLHRPSLKLQTIRLPSVIERMAWLADYLPVLPGSGIVYTLTVADTVRLARWLRERGLAVEAYSSESENRVELEEALLENRLKALVATTALGMGFDKPDIGFVVHYQAPGSVVAYYQQVGRAGRALDGAYGILLSGHEETDITDFFIESAFPTREEAAAVLAALEAEPEGLSMFQLLAAVNLSQGRVQKTLTLLSLESPAPIVKQGSKWQLTPVHLGESFWERTERLTELRRAEQAEMQRYVELRSGHMEFLIAALDGEPRPHRPPDLPDLPSAPRQQTVLRAVQYLRRTALPIEPRRRWPAGGMPAYGLRGRIDEALQCREGRSLSLWGDAGWGAMVRRGKYHDGRFDDQLVGACVDLLAEWAPDPFPAWVTCIPSLRYPELVPGFAQRLAEALGLPFAPALIKTEERPQQKLMENSIQQARNLDGVLALTEDQLLGRPVLLVDDVVDSRWTITVASWLLRSNGVGEVWPLVLAVAGARS